MTAARLPLPRSRRMKSGRDFARARTEGKRIAVGCLIANWVALPGGTMSRVGIVTSRRIGGAVHRSRARRLLREAFRRHQHDLAQFVDLVLVARRSIGGCHYAQVERDFLAALHRARLLNQAL